MVLIIVYLLCHLRALSTITFNRKYFLMSTVIMVWWYIREARGKKCVVISWRNTGIVIFFSSPDKTMSGHWTTTSYHKVAPWACKSLPEQVGLSLDLRLWCSLSKEHGWTMLTGWNAPDTEKVALPLERVHYSAGAKLCIHLLQLMQVKMYVKDTKSIPFKILENF